MLLNSSYGSQSRVNTYLPEFLHCRRRVLYGDQIKAFKRNTNHITLLRTAAVYTKFLINTKRIITPMRHVVFGFFYNQHCL
jgi:hypothetical protein